MTNETFVWGWVETTHENGHKSTMGFDGKTLDEFMAKLARLPSEFTGESVTCQPISLDLCCKACDGDGYNMVVVRGKMFRKRQTCKVCKGKNSRVNLLV